MAVENIFCPIGNEAFPANGVDVLHHDGKGLHRSSFTLAQGADGLFIASVAAEVKTADALDSDNFPVDDGLSDCRNGIPAPFFTVEKVQEVQKYGREPISLHTPLGEDGDSEFGDLIEDTDAIAPSDAVAFSLLQEQFKQVLETLSPREAGVIKMRYGLEDGQPKTLDDIGRVYGVTRERIRQIESKTMSKLRHPSRSQTLRDFLDQ